MVCRSYSVCLLHDVVRVRILKRSLMSYQCLSDQILPKAKGNQCDDLTVCISNDKHQYSSIRKELILDLWRLMAVTSDIVHDYAAELNLAQGYTETEIKPKNANVLHSQDMSYTHAVGSCLIII